MPWKECKLMDERIKFIGRILDEQKCLDYVGSSGVLERRGTKSVNGISNVE
jgi:hypothetical protein